MRCRNAREYGHAWVNRYEGTGTTHATGKQRDDADTPQRSGRKVIHTERLRRCLSGGDQRSRRGLFPGRILLQFDNIEEVFLAVKRCFSQSSTAAGPKHSLASFNKRLNQPERIAAVRKWFSNQWRLKDFIALRMEFSRRALRDRAVRKHHAGLRRRELETYAPSVSRHLDLTDPAPADRPEIVALVLLAVEHGLGSLAIHAN